MVNSCQTFLRQLPVSETGRRRKERLGGPTVPESGSVETNVVAIPTYTSDPTRAANAPTTRAPNATITEPVLESSSINNE